MKTEALRVAILGLVLDLNAVFQAPRSWAHRSQIILHSVILSLAWKQSWKTSSWMLSGLHYIADLLGSWKLWTFVHGRRPSPLSALTRSLNILLRLDRKRVYLRHVLLAVYGQYFVYDTIFVHLNVYGQYVIICIEVTLTACIPYSGFQLFCMHGHT